MIKDKKIGVVIPAYNENGLIEKVLTTMPDFVDYMITVNDGSTDNTLFLISQCAKSDTRIIVLDNVENKGLGQTLINGYIKARDMGIDVIAVMAGDAQMHPDDLHDLCMPIINEGYGYTKGNRLLRPDCYEKMPKHRFIGNAGLSFLTKFATGYWHVIDPQCGYTVISNEALSVIPIEEMTKKYGYNADILNMLNLANIRVKDVEVRPVYGDEQSKIKLGRYIRRIVKLLLKLFLRRMKSKYLLRDFNPLVFFYFFAFICIAIVGTIFLVRFFYMLIAFGELPRTTTTIMMFTYMIGYFSSFFGMWLDMDDNKKLK